MAYQMGLGVNSSVSDCVERVVEAPAAKLFFSRSKVKVLLPLPEMCSGRLSVTRMRLVSTGRVRSSPSAKAGVSRLRATMRQVTAPRSCGTSTRKWTSLDSPGFTSNGWALAPSTICKSALLNGLRNDNVTLPHWVMLSILTTLADNTSTSPSRRKRGTLGTTISFLLVCTYFSKKPDIISVLWAKPSSFQRVRDSGIVKLISTLPSSSVRR